jgi:uncharacterized cupin superfamily protein
MRRVNLDRPEFDHADGRPRRTARVGEQLGAALIGAFLYELGEAEGAYPDDLEDGPEQWLLVVDGEPTLGGRDGDRTLRRGDVLCFPRGSEGARALRGPGRVLLFSEQP